MSELSSKIDVISDDFKAYSDNVNRVTNDFERKINTSDCCLCFHLENLNSSVRLNKFGSPYKINLEYSLDGNIWNEYTWTGNNGLKISNTFTNNVPIVFFRGNNYTINKDGNNRYGFVVENQVAAYGNVMSMLDKTCQQTVIYEANCFNSLFKGCATLTKAPDMPATIVSASAYYTMYENCTSLKETPKLPIIKLANSSCAGMFKGCTSLVKSFNTILPKTIYGLMYVFESMFENCTSLEEVSIEVETIDNSSYAFRNIFKGCTALKCIRTKQNKWYNNTWLENASPNGTIIINRGLDTSTRDVSHIPAGWTIAYRDASNEHDLESTLKISTIAETECCITPSDKSLAYASVSSTLTINAFTEATSNVSYAEIVIDLAASATVTAGTNLTLADAITDGKRNVCVVRWSGGAAKLYVVAVEDLPA